MATQPTSRKITRKDKQVTIPAASESQTLTIQHDGPTRSVLLLGVLVIILFQILNSHYTQVRNDAMHAVGDRNAEKMDEVRGELSQLKDTINQPSSVRIVQKPE